VSLAQAQQTLAAAETSAAASTGPQSAAVIAKDKSSVASAQETLTSLQSTGTQITSPAAGTVTAVNLLVGQQVAGSSAGSSSSSSTTGQIEVMDLSGLQISGQASETDIAKLKMGQAATVTAAAIGSNTVVGQVCSVGLVGTQISGVTSYPVTVCLSGTGTGLLVGMSATAAVQTARADNAVLVPSLAVHTTGGQQTVNVLGADGTTQTLVPVTVGITNGSQTQILTGIPSGTTVVESLQTATSTGTNRTGGGAGGIRGVTGIGGGFGG
jgi:multidrug efflux pump subunit AcrA (membrane-fusion protein)